MNNRCDTQHLLALALSFLLLSLPVLAQAESGAPQRLEVRPGGPARIIKGQIRGRKEVVYIFRAKAGQKFSGRITRQTGDASFDVTDPDGEALPEEEFEVNTNLKGSLTK